MLRSSPLLVLFVLFAGAVGAEEPAAAAPAESDAQELDTVTIIGTRGDPSRISGSAHRIDRETLEQYGYDDINRVLNFVPGVYLREEDGYGLRPNIGMRGASSDRSQKVTLMEDGVLVAPAPYSAPAAYFFPLTSRMVGVEVFKGASSIQHGPQTIGGAINLISAPIPDKTEVLLDAALGTDEYRRVHARGGSSWGGLGLLGEAVHVATGGFKELDGGGDTGFEKNELLLKGALALGPGILDMRVGYADEASDETYLGLTEADFRDNPVRRYRASALDHMEWEWNGARLGWRQPLFGAMFRATAYLQNFDRRWRKFNNFGGADIRDVIANPDTPFNQLFIGVLEGADTDGVAGTPDDLRIGTNARKFVSSGLQGRMNWEFGDAVAHSLELGARLHYDRIRRLHDEFGFEQIGGQVVSNGTPRIITTENEANAGALALWVRDEIRFGRWTVAPGLRVESISAEFVNKASDASQKNDYAVVLPGIGTTYDLGQGLSVLGGVHKGFSPATPSLTDDVEPEEAINYEAGLRWVKAGSRFEAIGFYNDYSNLTATCTISSGCAPEDLDTQTNAGKVQIYGLEAGWDMRFALTSALSLPVALNYTYTHAEFREAFSSSDPQFGDVEPGFELPYVPEHRANASLGLAAAAWSMNLSATYISRMRDQAGEGSFAKSEGSDEVTVLDLAGHYDVLPALTLTGRVDNLLDDEYVVSRRPYGARPGKPAGVQVGITYRY
jgi:Fe(3+) dicitrate transport protein